MQSNNQYDFITIGIIVKNEANNIENTLKFLMQQSYPHEYFEIIISDGNSSDGTREIAKSFLEENNIQFKIFNEKNETNIDGGCNYGHSFARNVILDHTDEKSKYIAWIDGDCRADKDWLLSLWRVMIDNIDISVIGAGGRRIVENSKNISKKELMLNYYFTSKIMSMNNPAFCESDVKYMPSIAGYNSIYRRDIIQQYRYNTYYPFNTDDIEINFRLTQAGYKFLHAKEAKIYHRMDPDIGIFLKQMINYGKGAMDTSKIHKKIVRTYIPIGILYFLYTALLPIIGYISYVLFGNPFLPLVPYILVFTLSIFVFIENYKKTNSFWSFHIFYIVFLHPFMYGLGGMHRILRK